MTHTPGPWTVCRKGECSCKMVSGKDHPIATVECGEWGDEYPSIRLVGGSLERKAEAYMDRIGYGKIPEEVARANALLIAAAPDLYEAAKLWLSAYEENGPCITDAAISLRAAIAKAEWRPA